MKEQKSDIEESAYGSSQFLCGIRAYPMTESCYPCGRGNYWQSFEPRRELLESPPAFPSMKKWHAAGYGEKVNILGFYMQTFMKGEKQYRA